MNEFTIEKNPRRPMMAFEVFQEDIDYCNEEFTSFRNKKNRIEGFIAEKTVQRLVRAKPCKFIKEGEHPVADITFIGNESGLEYTVDVKNDTCSDKYLMSDKTCFCVPIREEHADWLLFTKYSPNSRLLVVVGLMNYYSMANTAKEYRKGEVIPEFGGIVSECDCYVIPQKDIPDIYYPTLNYNVRYDGTIDIAAWDGCYGLELLNPVKD